MARMGLELHFSGRFFMNSKMKPVVGAIVGAAIVIIFFAITRAQDPAYDGWMAPPPMTTWGISAPLSGDVNRDGVITPADVVALHSIMTYIHIADVNADTKINDADIEYLSNYVFRGGPKPKESTTCKRILISRDCWSLQGRY